MTSEIPEFDTAGMTADEIRRRRCALMADLNAIIGKRLAVQIRGIKNDARSLRGYAPLEEAMQELTTRLVRADKDAALLARRLHAANFGDERMEAA